MYLVLRTFPVYVIIRCFCFAKKKAGNVSANLFLIANRKLKQIAWYEPY